MAEGPAGSGGSDAGCRQAALYILASWLSPAFPVGAYTYSHGLEWAVAAGDVHDAETARTWIGDCLSLGAGRTDALLLAHAWRATMAGDTEQVQDLAELAEALAPSAERRLETVAQGRAFADATRAAWGTGEPLPYPVAVGLAAGKQGLPLADTALFYLQAFAANLVSACQRLVPLGQADGQRVIAALMPLCLATVDEAIQAPLDDIGGCALRSDIASMRHETQPVRLFRS